MRIYADLYEAAREIERDLYEMGIQSHSTTFQNKQVGDNDDFDTKELMGYSYSIPIMRLMNNPIAEKTLKYMGKDISKSGSYIINEIMDRIYGEGCNPGTSWATNPELWNEFKDAQGKFDYTYSERFFNYKQFEKTIEELKENLESRRAVLSVYDPSLDTTLRELHLRIPCSMYYQFMVRKINGVDTLSVIYVMRSCDFYEHWIHDVLMTMSIARHIADRLNVATGQFIHQIGSFHIYKRDYSKREIF